MIDWSAINKEDSEKIHKIAKRVAEMFPQTDLLDLDMDISATHLSCPLDNFSPRTRN